MSVTPPAQPSRPRRPALLLAGLTLAVLLGHWVILFGAPLIMVAHTDPKAEVNRPFTTRTITLAAQENLTAVSPRPHAGGPATPGRAGKPPQQPQTAAPDAGEATASVSSEAPPPRDQSADEAVETAALAPQPDATSPPAASPDKAQPVRSYAFPGSTRLKYDIKGEIKGFPYFANGELLWLQDGKTYDARLEISHFLLGSRVQTSRGQLTPQGLEPARFGDKVRSEVAAHFERSKNIVSFSANTPSAALEPGAQDQLSVFMQLGSLLGGNSDLFPTGTSIPFQAVGPRSSESWVFIVGEIETLTLPGGTVKTIQLTRDHTAEYDTKVEIWLAPAMDFLPVRIRLSQRNGDFVEQQWRATQKP